MIASKKQNTGFTLIELLIVIALLGALVIGLLAAIDPVEQIRRGRDTTLRDIAAQFYQAEQRYYTNRSVFTDNVALATPANNPSGLLLNTASVTTTDITSQLVGAGELKSQFANQVTGGTPVRGSLISVSVDTTGTTLSVCFKPESKSFTTDAMNNVYDSVGGACSAPGTNVCYTCIR